MIISPFEKFENQLENIGNKSFHKISSIFYVFFLSINDKSLSLSLSQFMKDYLYVQVSRIMIYYFKSQNNCHVWSEISTWDSYYPHLQTPNLSCVWAGH